MTPSTTSQFYHQTAAASFPRLELPLPGISLLPRIKHVSIAWHYVRTAVAAGIISPRKVWSAQNPSDLMTKAVARVTFTSLVNSFMTLF